MPNERHHQPKRQRNKHCHYLNHDILAYLQYLSTQKTYNNFYTSTDEIHTSVDFFYLNNSNRKENKMSKAIGSVLGTNVKADTSAGDSYLNYLKNYDTSYSDNASHLMGQEAYRLSQSLSTMPDFIYSVDGSDDARQRAENAVYQSYLDKLTPQYQTQMADLETRLANQGLSVGSEAYQRAVNDLTQQQNNALNQARYNSVTAGQDAFTQSLNNSISAAELNNNARINAVNQIYTLLQNTPTGYENRLNQYSVQQGVASQRAAAEQQSFNNTMAMIQAISGTAGAAMGGI